MADPADTPVPEQTPAGPGERGRAPVPAIEAAAVRAPTRGNRRLEALLEGVNGDAEVRSWWHMAQVICTAYSESGLAPFRWSVPR